MGTWRYHPSDVAAENLLAAEDGLAAVAEWEAEQGSLTADEVSAADAVLDRRD